MANTTIITLSKKQVRTALKYLEAYQITNEGYLSEEPNETFNSTELKTLINQLTERLSNANKRSTL